MMMIKQIRGYVILTLFLSLVALWGSAAAEDDKSNAEQLLRDVYAHYATLSSYGDEGVVEVESFSGDDSPYKYGNEFRTRYSAPDSLLLAWVEKKPAIGIFEYAVWGEGQELQSWYHFRGLRKEESWVKALSGAHGISNGVAWLIPPNLLGSCPVDPLERAVKVEFASTSSSNVNNEITVKVQFSNGSEDLISIDTRRKVITKVEYWMEHPARDHRAHTVITYSNIVTNKPIAEEELQFKPANKAAQSDAAKPRGWP